MLRIGLISDTHGLLRPQAVEALRGSHYIVHAGDIGNAGLLQALEAIAPVTAVRGNNDVQDWARTVPARAELRVGGLHLYVLHDIAELDLDPARAGYAAVIHGHSHRPSQRRKGAVWFVNPGSAGPRRFSLPVSVGELRYDDGKLEVALHRLDAL